MSALALSGQQEGAKHEIKLPELRSSHHVCSCLVVVDGWSVVVPGIARIVDSHKRRCFDRELCHPHCAQSHKVRRVLPEQYEKIGGTRLVCFPNREAFMSAIGP
jgi:hypothetical protein